MMPTAAIFGASLGQEELDLPNSYYEKEVRFLRPKKKL